MANVRKHQQRRELSTAVLASARQPPLRPLPWSEMPPSMPRGANFATVFRRPKKKRNAVGNWRRMLVPRYYRTAIPSKQTHWGKLRSDSAGPADPRLAPEARRERFGLAQARPWSQGECSAVPRDPSALKGLGMTASCGGQEAGKGGWGTKNQASCAPPESQPRPERGCPYTNLCPEHRPWGTRSPGPGHIRV